MFFRLSPFILFWWKPSEWLIFVTNRDKLQQQSIEAIVLPDRTHLDYYCHCILIFFFSLCLFLPHNFQVHTMHVPWNCHLSVSFKGCNVYGWINESVISGCHTYIHTYLPTYILWVHKCITKTIGCGTSHKYTSIYTFCSEKYYKYFIKQYYRYLYA